MVRTDPRQALGSLLRVLDIGTGHDVATLLQNAYPLQVVRRDLDRVYVVEPGADYRTQGSFRVGDYQTQVIAYEVGTWQELVRRPDYLLQHLTAW